MSLSAVDDYANILRGARPLIDVRSPAEFRRGAVPGAVNLPLLTDGERDAVGKTFRTDGRDAAVAQGHELVADDAKASRVAAWRAFAAEHPDALVTCWRGGLRSQIAQAWLADAGLNLPRIAGGFKALRHFCLDTIQAAGSTRRFVVVGGRTGSGKTRVVQAARAHVDLEALANHRGSAFGGFPTPQPPPVTFENALAVALLKLSPDEPVAVEDESRTIGRLALPVALYNAMQQAPIVLLEVDDANRVDNIYREYVVEADNPEPHLTAALSRIERRLGGVRYRELSALMDAAFRADASGRGDAHRLWIQRLLEYYYDPMYDYQLAGKKDRVAMRGTPAKVAAYLDALS
ncbi:MAG: tRNA 2-selenouridine(34) synthase MnmH [Gammaproteobacteria bacterium]|nr:tRNA 2-selenouridine(34) synthase MnmH [Gammaproteobacteria bacterium]